jgi:two-component system alkaline phosphatase synthesis response regulator PhoP
MNTKNNEIKIAVIEDDENLRFLVVHRLEKEGYNVIEEANGQEGEKLIMSEQPDLVLLDWMMPIKQGNAVCEFVREKGFDKPIIMMTAKAQDIDMIDAYNFGVSDYISKPFSMDLLMALVVSKLKYRQSKDNQEVHRFKGMEHYPIIHSLIAADNSKIELTILENRILIYFLKNPNKVIGRDELLQEVWGYSSDVNTRTLDMHIVRLRKKIEENSEHPTLLVTVRGMGYKFNLE